MITFYKQENCDENCYNTLKILTKCKKVTLEKVAGRQSRKKITECYEGSFATEKLCVTLCKVSCLR